MQKVCLIIPCYNEENRLNVKAFSDFLQKYNNLTFCFVNDGSMDRTIEILNLIKKDNNERIIVLHLNTNSGKAEAVRKGVLYAMELNLFEFIGYWDADISTPLEELCFLLEPFFKNENVQFVLGSRMKRLGSSINRKTMRHITGRIFSTFSSMILNLPVYDSQCGAKIFRSKISRILFEDAFVSKWLFDVELLARFKNHFGLLQTLQSCYEVPLSKWNEVGGSKLRFGHFMKVPFDLFKIYFHYNK